MHPPELLVALGEQRWLVPVMAAMHAAAAARFAELRHRLDLPRESLSRTLERAGELGWVRRNPGYGHPLRPEYVLTGAGREAAQAAAQICAVLAQVGLPPKALTRWSLPLLHALGAGGERFNEIARHVAPATPRALSQCLKRLAANDLVSREVEAGYPPTSRYRLTLRGLVFANCWAA